MKNCYFTLHDGVKIPKIGFGTWQIPEGEICYNSVLEALKVGYRHIDTAQVYGNELSVGRAIRDSGLKRSEVFVTTKVSANIKNYEEAKESIFKSLEVLNLEYIDLLLIHNARPWHDKTSDKTYFEENLSVWKAMKELQDQGLVRSIGVSNFKVKDLENLISKSGIVPTMNQIRYLIGDTQDEIVNYCNEKGIIIEAYSPLGTGKLLGNDKVEKIAKKYNKTLPQIAIRFCLENNILPLPKSVTPKYIKENFEIDFEISKEDMDYLNSLKDIL